jgi:hypothetical protein
MSFCLFNIFLQEHHESFYVHMHIQSISTTVEGWYIFKPKIPIWVNFGGPKIGKCWNILWPFGMFYGHLVQCVFIWYIFPFLDMYLPRKICQPWPPLCFYAYWEAVTTVSLHRAAVTVFTYVCMYADVWPAKQCGPLQLIPDLSMTVIGYLFTFELSLTVWTNFCGRKFHLPVSPAGLPDGLFSNQKSQFGYIWEGLRIENAGLFYGHLEYFTVIWYIKRPFGNVVVIWHISPHFGILCQEKSGNPGRQHSKGRQNWMNLLQMQ